MVLSMVCFFFFKQKTAYEMRISDWSSDVCSSDLAPVVAGQHAGRDAKQEGAADGERHHGIGRAGAPDDVRQQVAADAVGAQQVLRGGCRVGGRSEERRVGQACVSTGRSRW